MNSKFLLNKANVKRFSMQTCPNTVSDRIEALQKKMEKEESSSRGIIGKVINKMLASVKKKRRSRVPNNILVNRRAVLNLKSYQLSTYIKLISLSLLAYTDAGITSSGEIKKKLMKEVGLSKNKVDKGFKVLLKEGIISSLKKGK